MRYGERGGASGIEYKTDAVGVAPQKTGRLDMVARVLGWGRVIQSPRKDMGIEGDD